MTPGTAFLTVAMVAYLLVGLGLLAGWLWQLHRLQQELVPPAHTANPFDVDEPTGVRMVLEHASTVARDRRVVRALWEAPVVLLTTDASGLVVDHMGGGLRNLDLEGNWEGRQLPAHSVLRLRVLPRVLQGDTCAFRLSWQGRVYRGEATPRWAGLALVGMTVVLLDKTEAHNLEDITPAEES